MTQEVPSRSLRLTEELLAPSHHYQPPLPCARYQKPNAKDDQQQTNRGLEGNAETLNNRLSQSSSKATTLRNSAYYDQPDCTKKGISQSHAPPPPPPLPIHMPSQHETAPDLIEEENAWWIMKHDQDGFYSVGALLFLFGFLCPLFWWLGSFWPRDIKERAGKMGDRWQKLNRIMSVGFSSVLLILIIVFVILYATHKL